MKDKFKFVYKFFFITFYIILSIIKFNTIKVLQYDAPVTEIYFATNLYKQNRLYLIKGYILYNYKEDYSTKNIKAKLILQKDEFYDPIYDFIVGVGWFSISIILFIVLVIKIIKKFI